MKKHIPFAKLSKKRQREINRQQRSTWGPLNPVTRKPPDPKKYDRNKLKNKGDFEF